MSKMKEIRLQLLKELQNCKCPMEFQDLINKKIRLQEIYPHISEYKGR